MHLNESPGAVLLCGGNGTRLNGLTRGALPKSLVEIGNKPLIQYSIDSLIYPDFSCLVFAVGHQSDRLINWVSKKILPHKVIFSFQQQPGVLDAIRCGLNLAPKDENNAVCNTDEIRVGLHSTDALEYRRSSKSLATLVATYSDKLYRHGCMTIRDKDSRILSFKLKPEEYRFRPQEIGLIFTGMMFINKRAMDYFDPGYDKDWMGIIGPLLDANQLSAYVIPDINYYNVGTLEEYEEVRIFAAAYLPQQVATI